MNRLEEIAYKRKKAHTKFKHLKSRVYEKFLELEKAAFSEGALSTKTKELISARFALEVIEDVFESGKTR